MRTAVLRQVAQRKVVSRFALEDLGQRVPAHRGLHRILHVGDVDLIASGRIAVHCHVQIGLAQHAKHSQILNALDLGHDLDDLVTLGFENFQVVAVDLGGQRAFHSAHRLLHVVFDGLGETPDHARDFVELAIHGGDQFVFVLVKHRPPFFFRLEVDEEFGIKKAGRVGAVIRTAHLAGTLRHFGKRAQHDASLVRDPDALVRAGAGRKRAAHPERAFIEVRQKFRTDGAAEGEITSDGPSSTHTPMVIARWRMAQRTRDAIALNQEIHDRVMPFVRSLRESETCQHGRDHDREQQCPEQRKGYRPCHGMKKPALDALQRKDRQISGNDDGDRIEHRALDFVRGLADFFAGRFGIPVLVAQVAYDVFDHHHRAIDHHAKIQRAERQQVGGNVPQVQTDRRKQQRERNGRRNDQRAPDIAEEQEAE